MSTDSFYPKMLSWINQRNYFCPSLIGYSLQQVYTTNKLTYLLKEWQERSKGFNFISYLCCITLIFHICIAQLPFKAKPFESQRTDTAC